LSPNPPLFDAQKIETDVNSNKLVPISTVLALDAAEVCVLGSYSSVENHPGTFRTELAAQMDTSWVEEGYVRLALFDHQSKLLGEYDVSMWRGQVRISLQGVSPVFCGLAETILVKVIARETYTTIEFSE
jgi:hypothetical protein